MLEKYSITLVLQFYKSLIGYFAHKRKFVKVKEKTKDNSKYYLGNFKKTEQRGYYSFYIKRKKKNK